MVIIFIIPDTSVTLAEEKQTSRINKKRYTAVA